MKKILSVLLVVATLTASLFTLTSCFVNKDNTKLNIGVLAGPTGMGMAKLMNDAGEESEKYSFVLKSSPDQLLPELTSKAIDMACLPTNVAANLANKNSDYITVIAINTLGSLYLVAKNGTSVNDISDLQGKTIHTSVPTSTTRPILQHILTENSVSATIECDYQDHDALVAAVKAGQVEYAVLPEPKVTAALMGNTFGYEVKLNLNEEWNGVSDTELTMGCIVVRNEFLKEHKSVVDNFLKEYKASIEYVNNRENLNAAANMFVQEGIIPKLPIATSALSNLYGSIAYIDKADMKAALEEFYDVIGQAKPADTFYYNAD